MRIYFMADDEIILDVWLCFIVDSRSEKETKMDRR